MSTKQLTLLDLPIAVANQVLERLKPVELLVCRKVCRSLRNAIDKLGAHFTELKIWLRRNRVSIDLDGTKITYSNSHLGGTNVDRHFRRFSPFRFHEKKIFLRGENYLNIAFNDLKILLRHASRLMIEAYLEDKDREYAVHSLVDVLKEEVNIHMESIALNYYLSIDDILLILPLFNSQTLKNIELGGSFPDHEFERITHLDQWKNSKFFNFWDSSFECSSIEHFLHFEEFTFDTTHFPIQSAIQVRDDLLQRCTFQECTITVPKVNLKSVEFARIFQPDYDGGDKFTLDYSNGKSKFKINFGYSEFYNMWMFEIKRC